MKRWRDKPYYSLDAMLRLRFGEKVYKITLNGGMTCPNRDGTLGNKGCIFCSEGGSGDFAGSPSLSIPAQIEQQIQAIRTLPACPSAHARTASPKRPCSCWKH